MAAEGAVILTGGSTGIGAATAKALAKAGREIINLDIKEAPQEASAHFHCDLADPGSIDSVLGKLEGTFASLLNVAGVPGTVDRDTVVGVNTLGLRHLTDGIWDQIADKGTVVNVASVAGNQWKKRLPLHTELLDTPDYASGLEWWREHGRETGTDPYTFSKEAVVVYTMRLAGRGLSRGIQVNDVGPGPVDTPIFPDFKSQVGADQMDWMNEQVGRTGQPEDIAEVLSWLAIGDHNWLNGQHIIVDGGLTAGMRTKWIDLSSSPR